jgi:hypothetical protein
MDPASASRPPVPDRDASDGRGAGDVRGRRRRRPAGEPPPLRPAGIVALVGLARMYLAIATPTGVLVGSIIGVTIPLVAFRLLCPDEVFPVTYRWGRTAHLEVGGRLVVHPPAAEMPPGLLPGPLDREPDRLEAVKAVGELLVGEGERRVRSGVGGQLDPVDPGQRPQPEEAGAQAVPSRRRRPAGTSAR